MRFQSSELIFLGRHFLGSLFRFFVSLRPSGCAVLICILLNGIFQSLDLASVALICILTLQTHGAIVSFLQFSGKEESGWGGGGEGPVGWRALMTATANTAHTRDLMNLMLS